MKTEASTSEKAISRHQSLEDEVYYSSDDDWDLEEQSRETEEDSIGSDTESEHALNLDGQDCPQTLYLRAAEHIITQRVLPKPWFKRSPAVEVEIEELGKIVDGLLETYNEYFDNVVKREPWCERRGVSDFKKIAEQVLNSDEEQSNWTRIAMLLALATRVSRHFYDQRKSKESIVRFSRCVGRCIQERVNGWEEKGDRWEKLRQEGAASKAGATFSPLFGAGAAVISFLAVVVQFTMTSPIFINRLKT